MLPRHSRNLLRRFAQERTKLSTSRCFELSFSTKNDGKSASIGDYFSALRWKAANALTANLPDEERSLLLDKLSETGISMKSENDDSTADEMKTNDAEDEQSATSYEPSIDEAIAAAKLQEAERYKHKWESDKEALVAEAEKAARSRIESDLEIQKRKIAFEAWKSEIDRERRKDESSNDIEIDSNNEVMNEKISNEENVEHPVLGQMIADLGYKRLHLASSKNLATIPVWKKQRIYRHERSKTMVADKIKTLHLGLPGVIGIFEKSDGSLNIIDGQHRIGMLKMLEDKDPHADFDFQKVLVEVFPAQKETKEDLQMKEIFLEVNKAEPVKLVDLPGVAKAKDRKIINEVADRLRKRFPEMFSESQRCRAPHLNIDNLRDALFASKIIEKHSLKTSKALEEWILERNDLLETDYQNEENQKMVSANALKKAMKFKFYLGLESSWLYK